MKKLASVYLVFVGFCVLAFVAATEYGIGWGIFAGLLWTSIIVAMYIAVLWD